MARYKIVPARSQVWIDAKSSLHPIHSTTDGLEGYVDVDGDGQVADGCAPSGGRVSLPVSRLSSGNRLEDRELQKRIDAKRFPTIEGVLTTMTAVDGAEGRYRATGDVAFRGVTCPHEDDMTVTAIDDRTIRVEGSSTFDIRQFGMEPPKILLLRVEPDVAVRVEIVAEEEA